MVTIKHPDYWARFRVLKRCDPGFSNYFWRQLTSKIGVIGETCKNHQPFSPISWKSELCEKSESLQYNAMLYLFGANGRQRLAPIIIHVTPIGEKDLERTVLTNWHSFQRFFVRKQYFQFWRQLADKRDFWRQMSKKCGYSIRLSTKCIVLTSVNESGRYPTSLASFSFGANRRPRLAPFDNNGTMFWKSGWTYFYDICAKFRTF